MYDLIVIGAGPGGYEAAHENLTCDHQFIDGAPGARFLQAVPAQIAAAEALCTI